MAFSTRLLAQCSQTSIGTRLLLAFGVLGALFSFALYYAIEQTRQISVASQTIVTERLGAVALVDAARGAAQSGAALLYSLLLKDQRVDRVATYRRIDKLTAVRDTAIAELVRRSVHEDSREIAASIRTLRGARENFESIFLRTVEEVEIAPAKARHTMVAETMPALEGMLSALDRLSAAEWKRAEDLSTQIRSMHEDSWTASIAIGSICALFALAAALTITRSIARPLRRTADFAQEVASGHLDGPLPATGRDEVGALVRALDTMRHGIAERESRIRRLAYIDVLTGLPNRTLFHDRLRQALNVAARAGHELSVLVLDLDRFKQVNDVLGHPTGDELLSLLSRRLEPELQRASDTLARIGGDEFAVLLPTQGEQDAVAVARRILSALGLPVDLHGHTIDLALSIGIASYPAHGQTVEQLMSRADTAMYVAKNGGDGYVVFDPRYDRSSAAGLSLLGDLRRALSAQEFVLHLQPKIDVASGKCLAAEALIRWHPLDAAPVPPDQFIPFCEQTGFIRHITRWVLSSGCALAARLQSGGEDFVLSLNVSTRDLLSAQFTDTVRQSLQAAGLPAQLLCLEITESAIMEDPVLAQNVLTDLTSLGVRLSIDDFGTGYSSLAYLRRLPVSELKIDRSFVKNLDADDNDKAIVHATIGLAHSLGLKVVAEGVETARTVSSLKALGCDAIQGYVFSKPLAESDFLSWRQRHQGDWPYRSQDTNAAPTRSKSTAAL